MNSLLGALTSVAAAAAARSTMAIVTRMVWSGIGLLLVMLGVAFGIAAGYEALWIHYGTLASELIMAAIFILLGIIAFVIGGIQAAQRRRQNSAGNAAAVAAAFAMGMSRGMGGKKR